MSSINIYPTQTHQYYLDHPLGVQFEPGGRTVRTLRGIRLLLSARPNILKKKRPKKLTINQNIAGIIHNP